MRHLMTMLSCVACLWAAPLGIVVPHGVGAAEPPPTTKAPVKPYPSDRCLVSGERLVGPEVVSQVVGGQEFKFINHGALRKFLKEPEKYLEKFRRDVALLRQSQGTP